MGSDTSQVDIEIITVAVPPRVGGMTAWFLQIARGLSRLGWKVRLFGITDRWTEEKGQPYETVPILTPSPGTFPSRMVDKWYRWRRVEKDVWGLVSRSSPPRLRLTDSTPGVLRLGHKLHRRDRVPWVVVAGGDIFAETADQPLAVWLHRRLHTDLSAAAGILVDGPDLVHSLSSKRLPADRFRICYHGIDLDRFRNRSGLRRYYSDTPNLFRLAWHGRLGNHHGPLRFLDMVSSLEHVEARLCGGEGDQHLQVLERLESMGNPDWYLGVLPEEDLGLFLAEADCGAYPLRATAGTPTVILEAMAAGLACVVSNVGAVSEIISSGENGFLCRDREEMIRTIRALQENPDLKERIGRNARKTIEKNWSEEVTTRRLQEILEEFTLP